MSNSYYMKCKSLHSLPRFASKTQRIHVRMFPYLCPEAYIGETGRVLRDRVCEYLKAPSPIYTHSNDTGHPLDPICFNIIHKETLSFSRTIKEAMFVRFSDPVLNRNLGKYQLQYVLDSILQETSMLQLKLSSLPSPLTPILY